MSEQRIVERKARRELVPIAKMRVREGVSQRDFKPAWAAEIARVFNPDELGYPVVNYSEGWFWIVDGQHRIAALKLWLGEWASQKIECEVYESLPEHAEASLFLGLNTVRSVSAFDKFKVAVVARDPEAVRIDALLRERGLKVSRRRAEGAVSCVGVLRRVYRRGEECLTTALDVGFGAFGDAGLEADILEGIGLVRLRYGRLLDAQRATEALATLRGGVGALRTEAERNRHVMGLEKPMGVALAVVDLLNRGKGGPKLSGWWKKDAER